MVHLHGSAVDTVDGNTSLPKQICHAVIFPGHGNILKEAPRYRLELFDIGERSPSTLPLSHAVPLFHSTSAVLNRCAHASRMGRNLDIVVRADEALARTTRAMPLNHEDGGLVAELLARFAISSGVPYSMQNDWQCLTHAGFSPRFDALGRTDRRASWEREHSPSSSRRDGPQTAGSRSA